MPALEFLLPLAVAAFGLYPLWQQIERRRCLKRRLSPGTLAKHRLRRLKTVELILLGAFILAGFIGLWFALPWWLSLLCGLAAAWGSAYLWRERQKRLAREHFARDFPDAVEALLRAIQAGVPVDRALASLAELYPGELGRRFAQLAHQIELGVPFRDALRELSAGLALADVDFFCAALALNRDSGGLLSTTLQSLSRTLRERRAAQRKLSALTAESRSAARIVAVMPLIVLLVQGVSNPQQLQFLWHDDTGRMVALYALSSIGLGLFVIRRMSRF